MTWFRLLPRGFGFLSCPIDDRVSMERVNSLPPIRVRADYVLMLGIENITV
jgi:hypothetical protein